MPAGDRRNRARRRSIARPHTRLCLQLRHWQAGGVATAIKSSAGVSAVNITSAPCLERKVDCLLTPNSAPNERLFIRARSRRGIKLSTTRPELNEDEATPPVKLRECRFVALSAVCT